MLITVNLLLLLLGGEACAFNYSQYVDLFIGTQGTAPGTSYNGGNIFPGASLPFGGVKVGIDTTELGTPIGCSIQLLIGLQIQWHY